MFSLFSGFPREQFHLMDDHSRHWQNICANNVCRWQRNWQGSKQGKKLAVLCKLNDSIRLSQRAWLILIKLNRKKKNTIQSEIASSGLRIVSCHGKQFFGSHLVICGKHLKVRRNSIEKKANVPEASVNALILEAKDRVPSRQVIVPIEVTPHVQCSVQEGELHFRMNSEIWEKDKMHKVM